MPSYTRPRRCWVRSGYARMELTLARWLSLRSDPTGDHRTTFVDHGLSLHGLSAHVVECVLADRRDPDARVPGHAGRAGDRRPARPAASLLLRALHDVDVHA